MKMSPGFIIESSIYLKKIFPSITLFCGLSLYFYFDEVLINRLAYSSFIVCPFIFDNGLSDKEIGQIHY